ncbi:MAG: TGS domain-containing protein [Anaerolineales bacterium]|nr:TGS domain-containing protein [Anaerolineales bacterium]
MSRPKIERVNPRPSVEVHLPEGRVLSGPRGASAGDFLAEIQADLPAMVTGAVVNGELRELTYPIRMDARLTPVTMADADGARIYRRSLTFLLGAAFSDLYPEDSLAVDHSVASGGYFCQVTNRDQLTGGELSALQERMRSWVAVDEPFKRQEVSVVEATTYFAAKGDTDKVRLLSFRQKEYVTLYRLGDYLDYHHGYMLPATGYLKWFDLFPLGDGFILRFPQRKSPTELQPMPEYSQLVAAFRQYGQWLQRLGIDSVGALNEAIQSGRSREVLLVSEALHEQNIAEIARQISSRREQVRIVLIAGPSSSGKTTFSRRLAVQLLAQGLSPFALELDSFFVDRDQTPLDENGQLNFEALEAVDLGLLADHLQRLIAGQAITLPHYNFKAGRREPGEEVHLTSDHIVILEGIHGLNPGLLPGPLSERAFRIYASALTQLNLDSHNRVSTTDTRLIRRTVRDARERGYTAQQTIQRWESVRRGEERYIFPFQENAAATFNSALAYELSVLKPLAEPLLRQVPHGTPEFIEAKRLLALLDWFLPIEAGLIPDNSLLREFVGGSILKDFRIWKV